MRPGEMPQMQEEEEEEEHGWIYLIFETIRNTRWILLEIKLFLSRQVHASNYLYIDPYTS